MTKQNIETNKLSLKAHIIIINIKFDVEKIIKKLLTLRNIEYMGEKTRKYSINFKSRLIL